MMLKRCLMLALVWLSLNAGAVEKDKLSHFGGFSAIGFVSYSLLKDTEYPVAYTVGIGVLAGVATEWRDKNVHGGRFSSGDLAADVAGVIVGAYLGKGFYYLNRQMVYKKEF